MKTLLITPLPTLRRIAFVVLLCSLAVPCLAQQPVTSLLQAVRSADKAPFRAVPMAGVQGDEDWSTLFGLSGVYDNAIAIAVNGDDVYIGGDFDFAGTVTTAASIVRWNATTKTWSALGNDLFGAGVFTGNVGSLDTGTITALAVSGTKLYVGGNFSYVGDATNPIAANNVAVYDKAAGTWAALGSGMDLTVSALEVTDDGSIVFAGGGFTQAGGQAASGVAQINVNAGGDWEPLGAGLDSFVITLELIGNDLYAGGAFLTSGGAGPLNSVARWDGVDWQPLMDADGDRGVACAPGTVQCFVIALTTNGTDLFLGGNSSRPEERPPTA